MKIAIIGAGALGGYVGSCLADAGQEAMLYDIRQDYVAAVRKEGLTISPAGGQPRHYQPPITAEVSELGSPDAVIIATKAYHTRAAIEGVKSLVKPETLVVSFQNGYGNLQVLAEVVGNPRRIVAMTTAHNFLVKSPTHLLYFQGVGGVDLGYMQGGKDERLEELGAVMKHLKAPVKTHDDGHEVVWNKLLWNAVLNCTAAVTGLDVITMANTPDIGPVFKGLAAEYFEVSKAMGMKVWHPPNFIDLMMFAAKAAAKMQTVSPPKPSMLQDIEAGRPTEVDYINGAIVKEGDQRGIPTPVNRTMLYLVKTIEAKNLRAVPK
jgi:2-dehydropantoate 2-reductase